MGVRGLEGVGVGVTWQSIVEVGSWFDGKIDRRVLALPLSLSVFFI